MGVEYVTHNSRRYKNLTSDLFVERTIIIEINFIE